MPTPTPYYTVASKFSYTMDDETDASPSQFLDAVAQHLYELGAEDVAIFADIAAQTFMVSLIVPSPTGQTVETVVGVAMGLLRTAFHACDGATEGWPTPREAFQGVTVTPAIMAEASPTEPRAIAELVPA